MHNFAIGTRVLSLFAGLLIVLFSVQTALQHRTQDFYTAPVMEGSARFIEKQLACLTKNIYWEAASEPFEGKVAVAQVTLNRVESGKFADTVCGVVYQKTSLNSKSVCQFSWFCENNHLVKTVHQPLYRESEEVAKMVLLEGFRLKSVNEALYYHADYVNPKWNKLKVSQIGRHVFYKERQID